MSVSTTCMMTSPRPTGPLWRISMVNAMALPELLDDVDVRSHAEVLHLRHAVQGEDDHQERKAEHQGHLQPHLAARSRKKMRQRRASNTANWVQAPEGRVFAHTLPAGGFSSMASMAATGAWLPLPALFPLVLQRLDVRALFHCAAHLGLRLARRRKTSSGVSARKYCHIR